MLEDSIDFHRNTAASVLNPSCPSNLCQITFIVEPLHPNVGLLVSGNPDANVVYLIHQGTVTNFPPPDVAAVVSEEFSSNQFITSYSRFGSSVMTMLSPTGDLQLWVGANATSISNGNAGVILIYSISMYN